MKSSQLRTGAQLGFSLRTIATSLQIHNFIRIERVQALGAATNPRGRKPIRRAQAIIFQPPHAPIADKIPSIHRERGRGGEPVVLRRKNSGFDAGEERQREVERAGLETAVYLLHNYIIADYLLHNYIIADDFHYRQRHNKGEVAQVQAEAFHTPVALFDFLFFKAEVLSGLLYKLRNTTPNRRQKVGSVLLTACDNVARLWGFEYLALQAYADDMGARALYAKAGYRVASSDPQWFALIGRRPRVLTSSNDQTPLT
ncbi:hypothetical protein LINGRAPRIM_LOCUS3384 [Linum grandiflorum]